MQQVTECWQGHLGETELLGFLVVAMSTELGGAGWILSVGLSLTLSF